MKNKLILLLTLAITGFTFAQQGINYKALIKDGSGNVVTNDLIVVQFIIYEGAALTNNVYQETHTPNTDANGIIIINIGEGTVNSGVFADIDWGSDEHFLNIQINTGGGLTDMGTTQFMAVPYALSAANAASKIDDLTDAKSDNDGTQDGSSVFLGINAGSNDDSTNNQNVGIGYNTLKSNTSGKFNAANGYAALFNSTTGDRNTANGNGALYFNTTGSDNVANGFVSLYNNTIGNNNTASGTWALYSNISGNNNTANGYQAGFSSIGNSNIFIGYMSGYNETGNNKLYIEASNAGPDNALIYGEFDTNILRTNSEFQIGNPTVTGFSFPTVDGTANQLLQTDGNGALTWVDNSGFGASKIDDLTDAKSDSDGTQDGSSVFLGISAGANDDSSDNKNVGIGYQVLLNNSTGFWNTANGYQALYTNSTGAGNTANGYQALYTNDTGPENTAQGSFALFNNSTGRGNTANGYLTLNSNNTGDYNTAIGYQSLQTSTSGNNNTAIGKRALYSNFIGYSNTATGTNALYTNTWGYENTANGYQALYENTQGYWNTGTGYQALLNNIDGDSNTAIGKNSLYGNTTGNNNTAIGYNALFSSSSGSNNIAIGSNAQVLDGNADNQVRIGNSSITLAEVQVAWTVPSDKRWKKQIRELPYGLELLKQLKPVDYIRKNNAAKTRDMGFIAQDVEALLTKISYTDQGFLNKDDKGFLSLRYNDFIALLTKAIQEQQVIIDNQNSEIQSLTSELVENKEENTVQNKNIKQLLKRMQQIENLLNN